MLTPPQNHLVFSGFGYGVDAGERRDNAGKTEPIKVLTFRDQPSMLGLSFVFSESEWEKFMETIGEKRIIAASAMPPKLK